MDEVLCAQEEKKQSQEQKKVDQTSINQVLQFEKHIITIVRLVTQPTIVENVVRLFSGDDRLMTEVVNIVYYLKYTFFRF